MNSLSNDISVLPEVKRYLGEKLIIKNLISDDQLIISLKEQRKKYRPLGEILISLGFINETDLYNALGEIILCKRVDLEKIVPDEIALGMLNKEILKELFVMPVSYCIESKTLSLAMVDVFDLVLIDKVRNSIGCRVDIQPLLSGKNEILNAIDRCYGFDLSVDGVLDEIETVDKRAIKIDNQSATYNQTFIRLVNAILSDAVKFSASDIHFEPEADFLRLRYRVDGVLRQVRSIHKDYWPAIGVRLKVIANMNITETHIPQDGQFSLQIQGQKIDFRVSSQPVIDGENIVLRVLNARRSIDSLENLNIYEKSLADLKMMISRPEGIILVTGPTGSGKTTTLYSILNYIKSEQINIMTLEDPVEYPMAMICQTSINKAQGMGFSNGIRSIMRQDPDVILIGEIRDCDTAEIAFRAAMTGHQVYTTLHSCSAIAAIPRLLDIGVSNETMSGNITGIIAQRLVRRLCDQCKEVNILDEKDRRIFKLNKNISIYKSKGCQYCNNSGYIGRIAIMEVLKFNNDIDDFISAGRSVGEIKKYLRKNNFYTLMDDALRVVINGFTSLEEICRVVDFSDRI